MYKASMKAAAKELGQLRKDLIGGTLDSTGFARRAEPVVTLIHECANSGAPDSLEIIYEASRDTLVALWESQEEMRVPSVTRSWEASAMRVAARKDPDVYRPRTFFENIVKRADVLEALQHGQPAEALAVALDYEVTRKDVRIYPPIPFPRTLSVYSKDTDILADESAAVPVGLAMIGVMVDRKLVDLDLTPVAGEQPMGAFTNVPAFAAEPVPADKLHPILREIPGVRTLDESKLKRALDPLMIQEGKKTYVLSRQFEMMRHQFRPCHRLPF